MSVSRNISQPMHTSTNVPAICSGAKCSGPGRALVSEHAAAEAAGHQQQAVVDAPQHVVPAGAVPEAREHERRHDVRELAAEAFARAAQRDVDVVAEPRGQRDVPAAPEVLGAARQVRMVEIDHQLEAEPARRAARDIAVGREVRVDLDREREDARPQDLEGRRLEREDLVGDQPDVVGNHQLLEKAPRHQPQARAGGVGREASLPSTCGSRRDARSMGPATSCGKNAT